MPKENRFPEEAVVCRPVLAYFADRLCQGEVLARQPFCFTGRERKGDSPASQMNLHMLTVVLKHLRHAIHEAYGRGEVSTVVCARQRHPVLYQLPARNLAQIQFDLLQRQLAHSHRPPFVR